MQRLSFVVFIAALFFLNLNPTIAGPRENEFGAGSVSSSLAGSGIASLSNAAATYLNPANLAWCKKSSAEVGVGFNTTRFKVKTADGGEIVSTQTGDMFAVQIGGCAAPLNGLGIGVWVSSDALEPIEIGITTPKDTVYFARFDRALNSPSLMAGVGYAFIPELSLGLAISVDMNAHITQDVYAPLSDNGRTFSTEIGATVRSRASIVAGLTFKPWDFAGIAGTFRTANHGQLDVNAKTQAAFIIPIPPIKVDMMGIYNYSPQQFGLGLFYKPMDTLTLMADLNYAIWSSYRGPYLKVTPDPTSSMSSGIPLPLDENFGFRNTFIPKVGAEMILDEVFAVRAGYGYHQAIVGPPQGQANLIDGDTHTVSVGGGYRMQTESVGLRADFFVATHIMPTHSVQKNATNGLLAYSFGGIAISSGLNAGIEF